jgi:hypothetical protein
VLDNIARVWCGCITASPPTYRIPVALRRHMAKIDLGSNCVSLA